MGSKLAKGTPTSFRAGFDVYYVTTRESNYGKVSILTDAEPEQKTREKDDGTTETVEEYTYQQELSIADLRRSMAPNVDDDMTVLVFAGHLDPDDVRKVAASLF